MKREDMTRKIRLVHEWDVIVIGGGATGLWCALDAASRGFKTLLLEKGDFAGATSSKSTKLFHGGLRYLKQGHLGLVHEALVERGRLAKNAPHLFTSCPFLIPYYNRWDRFIYSVGMYLYDLLAKGYRLGSYLPLSKEAIVKSSPNLRQKELKGGCLFYDGQFDDARFAVELAKTIDLHGGVVLNHAEVHAFTKQGERISGVAVIDHENGDFFELQSKVVINASGAFVDEIRKLDNPLSPPIMSFSRGTHIVLDKSFLPGDAAVVIPKTADKRLIFLIPWLDRLLIGTTDVAVKSISSEECLPSSQEINFLLETARPYLEKAPSEEDIKSAFAGIRPLVKRSRKSTSKLSRSHKVLLSPSGLITIAGGKWTTARKMAEDTIDKAISSGKLRKKRCITKDLPLYRTEKHLFQEPLHKSLPYTKKDIELAVEEEMALTLIDVLARRTRILLLDAELAIAIAPKVARIMAEKLDKDPHWIESQIHAFTSFARGYLGHFADAPERRVREN